MIQKSLFPDFQRQTDNSLHLKEAAEMLDVSIATIRNWIKTDYLELTGKNQVSKRSVIEFQHKIAGREKLTSRANKSQTDSHDHRQLTHQIQQLLHEGTVDGATVSRIYEDSLSNTYRNKEGIYYTPDEIAQRFFDFLPDDCSELTFCDPCCGTGNFLIAALNYGFKPENIYGMDVDPIAIAIAKKRFAEFIEFETDNISCTNFLEQHDFTYDVIFTNPPWGKKLRKDHRKMLSATFQTGRSNDTSAIFFFACLSRLNINGHLGMLLQDAFFNVASFEDARQKALALDIQGMIDFGKPFKGLLTKAKGIILRNREKQTPHLVCCDAGSRQHLRRQDSFARNPKSIFNFTCTAEEATVIEHLFELEHVTLSGQAQYGLGIVTGNNKKFCISHDSEGYIPVTRGTDIQKGGLKRPSVYIPADLSLYQQVAPVELYQAKEKLIYKFISSDLVFFLDSRQRFLLNSANMLILNETFPISPMQLCDLLNSSVLNWFFKSVFGTHKVLRSDIESLPIHTNYFKTYNQFSETTFLDFLGIDKVIDGTFRIKA